MIRNEIDYFTYNIYWLWMITDVTEASEWSFISLQLTRMPLLIGIYCVGVWLQTGFIAHLYKSLLHKSL
jgi:hypothetical protein